MSDTTDNDSKLESACQAASTNTCADFFERLQEMWDAYPLRLHNDPSDEEHQILDLWLNECGLAKIQLPGETNRTKAASKLGHIITYLASTKADTLKQRSLLYERLTCLAKGSASKIGTLAEALLKLDPSIQSAKYEIQEWKGQNSKQEPARFEFTPASEIINQTFPPTPWLVQGLLTGESVIAIGAEPKTTKTWCAIEIALAVVSGTKAFDRYPVIETGPAVLFLLEDQKQAVRNRIRALSAHNPLRKANLHRVHLAVQSGFDLTKDIDVARIVASVRSLPEKPKLLIIDPLVHAHTANENWSVEMTPVMENLRIVRNILGCAVVFIHHTTKSSVDTKSRRPGQRLRGSGAIHGAVDGGIYLYNTKGDYQTTFENDVCVELKSARGAGEFCLRLDITDNEYGEALEAKWAAATKAEYETQAVKEETGVMDEAILKQLALEPMSGKTLFGLVKGTDAIKRERLAYLEAAGRVRKIGKGPKQMWQVVEPEDD